MTPRAHQWYGRAVWRGENGVRKLKLRRDPLCEVIGCNKPATTVDHRRKFQLGKTDAERWFLFLGGTNCENLRSCCQQHHDDKPDAYETGKTEWNPISATGGGGRQFSAGVCTRAQIDAALPQSQADIDELLAGLPE